MIVDSKYKIGDVVTRTDIGPSITDPIKIAGAPIQPYLTPETFYYSVVEIIPYYLKLRLLDKNLKNKYKGQEIWIKTELLRKIQKPEYL